MATQIIVPVIVLGVMALIIGVALAVAAKRFEVKEDERIPKVRAVLPGANCGGCGYPGCDGCAAAIVKGEAPVNACPVGGAAVAEKVGAIMGEAVDNSMPNVAQVLCGGDCEKAPRQTKYYGLKDCNEAVVANGGPKGCRFGCIGLGSCVSVCEFDALHMTDKMLPEVNINHCVACGKCVDICPKNVMTLIPKDQIVHVDCQSREKGKLVRQNCEVGCIGCGMCERTCMFDAIHVQGNLAVIDYSKCSNCGACVKKCPTHALIKEGRKVAPRKGLKPVKKAAPKTKPAEA